MLNVIEKEVLEHPFTTLEELRQFIDRVVEDMFARNTGRHPATIKQAHAMRASV